MSTIDHIAKLEEIINSGRVPGTSRTLLNIDKATDVIRDLKEDLPDQVNDAQTVIRQKEAILKQAENEARKVRAYADEEATTIRKIAEEDSQSQIEMAKAAVKELTENSEVTKEAEVKALSIEKDTQKKVVEIERKAKEKAERILTEAHSKIENMIENAEKDAEKRRYGADNYSREVLFALEERIADTLGQVRSGIDLLDNSNIAVGD